MITRVKFLISGNSSLSAGPTGALCQTQKETKTFKFLKKNILFLLKLRIIHYEKDSLHFMLDKALPIELIKKIIQLKSKL